MGYPKEKRSGEFTWVSIATPLPAIVNLVASMAWQSLSF